MSKRLTANETKWVDDRVHRFFEAFQEQVPDDSWMPREGPCGFYEHGCGSYGCVMPTGREDTVFKLTTDESEAMFARVSIRLSGQKKSSERWDEGIWPPGIVRYNGVYHMKNARFLGRPVFALWRDAAEDIGFLTERDSDAAGIFRTLRTFVQPLRQTVHVAVGAGTLEPVREMMDDFLRRNGRRLAKDNIGALFADTSRTPQELMSRYDLVRKAALGLAFYEQAIDLLSKFRLARNVARAMEYYYAQNIVFTDLHNNNIGLMYDEEAMESCPAITDPGQAVFLTERYDRLEIQDLESDAP